VSEVLLGKHEGVASITLNRPEQRNALSVSMCHELLAAINEIHGDLSVRVVVLNAMGTDFTVGADLKEMSDSLPADAAERSGMITALARDLSWPIFRGLHDLSQPIIASVRGHAIGVGAQLVISSDLVVASETMRLLIPQVRLGHSVDHCESWYLPRKTGMAKAMQLTLLADTLGAADAERSGLVNWVVSDDKLEEKTGEIIGRIAANAPIAVREVKALLRRSLASSLEEQFSAEEKSLGRCVESEDFLEALGAFVEKRKPQFRGR